MSRVILLCGAISAVSVPLFFGHWLVTRSSGAAMLAGGMAVVAVALIGLHMRVVGPDADA